MSVVEAELQIARETPSLALNLRRNAHERFGPGHTANFYNRQLARNAQVTIQAASSIMVPT